jgi:epoxyqueuosine reductase
VSTPTAEELRSIGEAAGLDAVGITSADPLDSTRTTLEERRAKGLSGTMAFTYKNPQRSTDPRAALPSASSIVVAARRHEAGQPARPAGVRGRVARYVRTAAYDELRGGLDVVAERLRRAGHRAVVLADENHLVDRAVAHRAGIGWFGKSSNLLLPGQGSWFVLGSVLTDAVIAPVAQPVADGCGSCHRCIDACPTGAIVASGVVDARRCLAWLVQAPEPIPVELRAAVGDRLYGCDDCQEVCPPNLRAPIRAERAEPDAAWVDVVALLDATDDELLARFGAWYIADRDPRYLRRTALVVLGNTAPPDDPSARRVLAGYVTHADLMLREHAEWARDRLVERTRPAPPGVGQ